MSAIRVIQVHIVVYILYIYTAFDEFVHICQNLVIVVEHDTI
jgi:hypothetical protein